MAVQPLAVPEDQQHARPADLLARVQEEPRGGHAGLGLQLRAGGRNSACHTAGPSEADQDAAALGSLDIEERQLLVAGEIPRAELHDVGRKPRSRPGERSARPESHNARRPNRRDRSWARRRRRPRPGRGSWRLGVQVDLDRLLAAAKHFRFETARPFRRHGKHDRAFAAAGPLVVIHPDPCGERSIGLGERMQSRLTECVPSPCSNFRSPIVSGVLMTERSISSFSKSWRQVSDGGTEVPAVATANRPREGHEVVGAATAAVGPMNRVAPSPAANDSSSDRGSDVLDQRRILAAGVLERQEGIYRRVVEEALDVPGRLSVPSWRAAKSSPASRHPPGGGHRRLELPGVAAPVKSSAVVAEAEGQHRRRSSGRTRPARPVCRPSASSDSLEPSFDQGHLALGRNAALGKMRRQRLDRPIGRPCGGQPER